MKRRLSSEGIGFRLINKRAKMDAECEVVFNLPEIFALILSFLVYKPLFAINLGKTSTKCYANMHSESVWRQMGFKNVMANSGRIDNNVLTVMLQKIEYDRLTDKHTKAHIKVCEFDNIREQRRQNIHNAAPGEEAKQFGTIWSVVFVHQKAARILTGWLKRYYQPEIWNIKELATIADRLSARYDYEFIPVLFRAFQYLLGSSKSDLERKAEQMPRSRVDDAMWGNVFPLLTKVQPDKATMTTKQAELYSNSFIVFSSNSNVDFSVRGSYSCFFRYCCGDTKAVFFVMQEYEDFHMITDYYKVNLLNKSIESSGSILDLKFSPRGPKDYTLLTGALIDLFEMSISEEEVQQISVEDWLERCDVKLLQWLDDYGFVANKRKT